VVNNHNDKRQYILYRCGASLSDLDLSSVTLPTGYTRRSYSTPAQKVAAFDTTVLGYLQAIDTGVGSLGLADRLVSISSYAVDPCMRKAVTTCTSNKGEGARRVCPIQCLQLVRVLGRMSQKNDRLTSGLVYLETVLKRSLNEQWWTG
jgi:hypothetical protein